MKLKFRFYFFAAGILYGCTSFAQSPGQERQADRQQQEMALMDSLGLDSLQKVLFMNIQEQYGVQIRNLREKYPNNREQVMLERQELSAKRDEQLRVIFGDQQWEIYQRIMAQRRERWGRGR